MGPRPFRRGNTGAKFTHAKIMHALQWGHVLSDVEMRHVDRQKRILGSFNGATSFQTWK